MEAMEICDIDRLNRLAVLTGAGPGSISSETAADQVDQLIERIQKSWDAAVFSNQSDESIRRYFHYVQTELCLAVEECIDQGIANALLTVIDSLYSRHGAFADRNAVLPGSYAPHFLNTFMDQARALYAVITASPLDPILKTCLLPLFHDILNTDDDVKRSFASLCYFRELNDALKRLDWQEGVTLDGAVSDMLENLNFNHLGFFSYRQQTLSASLPDDTACRLRCLRQLKMRYFAKGNCTAYDPAWPDLAELLSGWLAEEVRFAEACLLRPAPSPVSPQKLPLNVSVAHLALIIRMFVEEKLIAHENLTFIFNFICRHFRSKRQSDISPGSFSKEYYSSGQVTAAVVRDYFLRMARRIDQDFFPAWVVVSAAALAGLNIR